MRRPQSSPRGPLGPWRIPTKITIRFVVVGWGAVAAASAAGVPGRRAAARASQGRPVAREGRSGGLLESIGGVLANPVALVDLSCLVLSTFVEHPGQDLLL